MVWCGGCAASRVPQNPAISVFLSDFISADIAPQNKRSLMFQHRWIARSILVAALVIGYAQQSSAADFSSETFLSWKANSQRFYLSASINMAGIVATQRDGGVARCVDTWHGKQRQADYQGIIGTIRENSEYHPQGIILAVLKNECGLR